MYNIIIFNTWSVKIMKIIAELSIIPIGVGLSLSEYIAECERILKSKGLQTQLHAEGTNVEGELDDVFEAIKACIDAMHKQGVPRLVTNVKVSSRTDKQETMRDRINSVENKI